MTGIYLTEEEQIEQLKKFIKSYGVSIVLGILIAIAASVGYRYYKGRQAHIAVQAAVSYSQLLDGVVSNQPTVVTRQANYLLKEYPKTPYATMASLFLARQAINDKQPQQALVQLNKVINEGRQPAMVALARLRAARVYLSMKQYTTALNILAPIKSKAFLAVKSEITGDIMVAQNKPEKARLAYQVALKNIDQKASMKPVLEMKQDNVAA